MLLDSPLTVALIGNCMPQDKKGTAIPGSAFFYTPSIVPGAAMPKVMLSI